MGFGLTAWEAIEKAVHDVATHMPALCPSCGKASVFEIIDGEDHPYWRSDCCPRRTVHVESMPTHHVLGYDQVYGDEILAKVHQAMSEFKHPGVIERLLDCGDDKA